MNKRLMNGLFYIPSLILAIIYFVHGFDALMLSRESLNLISIVGFSESTSRILSVMVGIVDILIALMVLFMPRIWNLVWAALWPVIPSVLEFVGGGEIEPEFVTTTILAILVY